MFAETKNAQIIGSESLVKRITAFAKAVSISSSPILISGETGTGKSLIAQYIYSLSEKHTHSLKCIPLSELPAELFESQLFGHKKGAFTNAISDFPGLIETADNGTVILEEIDCLPLYMQPKILRLIEIGEYQCVGQAQVKKCNIRFIATVNKCLKSLVEDNLFRSDLYYRLNVLTLHIPPLRARKDDIVLLIDYFSSFFSLLYRRPKLQYSNEAMMALLAYKWPGNVRELKAEIERLYVFVKKDATEVCAMDLTADILEEDISSATAKLIEEVYSDNNTKQRQNILDALNKNKWNKSQAAKELGISRKHLYDLMAFYEIQF